MKHEANEAEYWKI